MFSLFRTQKATTAIINGAPVTVAPKETLLLAALRHGLDFPNSCRVGGCGTCKCKLVSGRIRALTDAGYILSNQELDEGYILACQSVPLTEISVRVDGSARSKQCTVAGRVIAQQRLTHDITRLVVRLDETLSYRAGQFADLSLESLPKVSRPYSFASPPQMGGQCSFFVRKVPGGQFSTCVNETNLIGHRVMLKGPSGDFWLRPAEAPLLFVAGGSGLAPILAILLEAVALKVARPVTLLFGARQQRDLYALEDIREIAVQWPGAFRFVPVLSEEPAQSGWAGETGLVTEKIPALLEAGVHAYLCGPPAMIDSAAHLLAHLGIPPEHIHADRFVTQADAPLAA